MCLFCKSATCVFFFWELIDIRGLVMKCKKAGRAFFFNWVGSISHLDAENLKTSHKTGWSTLTNITCTLYKPQLLHKGADNTEVEVEVEVEVEEVNNVFLSTDIGIKWELPITTHFIVEYLLPFAFYCQLLIFCKPR